ncbi:MAG: hypothetical protein ACRD0E_09920 [Acidimicrobiales bacterium]
MPAANAKKTQKTTVVGDQVLGTVRQAQDYAVQAVRSLSNAVEPIIGRFPSVGSLPIADRLPTPERTVDGGFGFVSQVIDNQHAFAKNVLAATKPARRAAGLK